MRPLDKLRADGVAEWIAIESAGEAEGYLVTVRATGQMDDGTTIDVELQDEAETIEKALTCAAVMFGEARRRTLR